MPPCATTRRAAFESREGVFITGGIVDTRHTRYHDCLATASRRHAAVPSQIASLLTDPSRLRGGPPTSRDGYE